MCACAYFYLLSILQDFWGRGKRNHHQLSLTARKNPLFLIFAIILTLMYIFMRHNLLYWEITITQVTRCVFTSYLIREWINTRKNNFVERKSLTSALWLKYMIHTALARMAIHCGFQVI